MTWLLLIAGVALTIVKILFGDRVENPEQRKANYDKIIGRIKEDSKAIHFTFEECTFVRLDTSKKRRRKMNSKSTSLGVNRKGAQELEKKSKTEITCKKLAVRKEFVSTFPIDLEIAKTKTFKNNGITVYVEKEGSYLDFEEEEYYMDLNFLDT